jgi:hypothetical protein
MSDVTFARSTDMMSLQNRYWVDCCMNNRSTVGNFQLCHNQPITLGISPLCISTLPLLSKIVSLLSKIVWR